MVHTWLTRTDGLAHIITWWSYVYVTTYFEALVEPSLGKYSPQQKSPRATCGFIQIYTFLTFIT